MTITSTQTGFNRKRQERGKQLALMGDPFKVLG